MNSPQLCHLILNKSTTTENDDATSMSVAEAKTWFEANKQPDMVLKDGNLKEIKKIGIKPDWGSGATSKNSDIEVVETGMQVQGGFGFADEPSYSQWKVNKDNTLISSVTRMVFMKNKKSGKIDQFLMTIVGNKEYHDNNAGQLVGNAYLKRDKHFSGHIYYNDLAGNFVNGWKYENGKLVAESTQTTDEVLPIHLKLATCSTYAIYTIYVDCIDWYVNGLWDHESCGAPYAILTGSYSDCMINPPNNNTGVPGSTKTGVEGGYNPPAPCDCLNVCLICGKCKDSSVLKSADLGGCEVCICPINPVINDNLLANYPCASSVLQSYTNFNTFISNTLQSTFGVSQKYNVTFKGDLTMAANIDGTRTGGASGSIKGIENIDLIISINDFVLKNSTKEYIAVTYAHETLHALIDYYNATDPQRGNELFPIFYEMVGFESGQHLTMAMKYVDSMVDVIMKINPSMPSSDASFLAWIGLQGTRVYDQKRSDYDSVSGSGAWDRDIYLVQTRERNGSIGAKGTKCTP